MQSLRLRSSRCRVQKHRPYKAKTRGRAAPSAAPQRFTGWQYLLHHLVTSLGYGGASGPALLNSSRMPFLSTSLFLTYAYSSAWLHLFCLSQGYHRSMSPPPPLPLTSPVENSHGEEFSTTSLGVLPAPQKETAYLVGKRRQLLSPGSSTGVTRCCCC